jgi:predicted phage baseplate assembly protein
VSSLEPAGPQDRVYTVAQDEDGAARIMMGDGTHGARLPTGAENVTATYRAGIGGPGAVAAGQVSLLVRRPLGIRDVVNPAAAHDWAPAETLEEARVNAPLRVRTLDRAVSVTDFEDFARGFAGIGAARADLVWDGRVSRVVLTLLGTGAVPVSDALLGDLRAALDAARDPSAALDLVHGEVLWFGVRVEITRDPTHEPDVVDAAVIAALQAAFAPTVRTFAAPVAAASALVVVRAVPGVLACTMPRLLPLAGPGTAGVPPVLPPDDAARDPLTALPGRAERGVVVPAQLLGIAAGGVDVAVMAP